MRQDFSNGVGARQARGRIFINDEYGSFTNSQFRRFGMARKLKLMEAWFRERYEDPNNETPRVDGEYIYPWGGPFDAFDELGDAFRDLVDDPLIELLANHLQLECIEWAPTGNYQDGPEQDEDDASRSDYEPPLTFGSDEELSFREEIVRRLDRVEAILAERPNPKGLMGHNHPPDSIDGLPAFESIAEALEGIKAELAKPRPSVAEVGIHCDTADSFRERIGKAIARNVDVATDAFAKKIGETAGSVPFWIMLYQALHDFLTPLRHWIERLLF